MHIEIAKDAAEWNSIVERSPFSVLHHRYEVCVYEDKSIPLIIKVRKYRYLFPLKIIDIFRSFRVSFSPIYYYASLLPESHEAVYSMPAALDFTVSFLRKIGVDYLSSCAPTFLARRYAGVLDSWFRKRKASVQIIYAHVLPTEGVTFEDIWKNRFEKHARNQVRKAGKEGVNVIKINTEKGIDEWIEDIYQCNLSALKRQGRVGAYPDSYKEILHSELVSTKKHLGDYFNIYGAVYRGRLVAYMITREYKGLLHINKAMSHTQFLRKCPNDALINALVKEACEGGFRWIDYGFDRVRRGGKLLSLYPTLQKFKFKFGFEEVPVPIYRLGLSHKGKFLRSMYSSREAFIANSARIPSFIRGLLLKLYVLRHRRFFGFLHV